VTVSPTVACSFHPGIPRTLESSAACRPPARSPSRRQFGVGFGRDTPHLLLPRLQFVFFSTRPMVESEQCSTCSPHHAFGQQFQRPARPPFGLGAAAMAISFAPFPVEHRLHAGPRRSCASTPPPALLDPPLRQCSMERTVTRYAPCRLRISHLRPAASPPAECCMANPISRALPTRTNCSSAHVCRLQPYDILLHRRSP